MTGGVGGWVVHGCVATGCGSGTPSAAHARRSLATAEGRTHRSSVATSPDAKSRMKSASEVLGGVSVGGWKRGWGGVGGTCKKQLGGTCKKQWRDDEARWARQPPALYPFPHR